MTESTTGKTVKSNAAPFGPPKYETPKFDLPKMEVPEVFREMAEKGVAQVKDTCEKMTTAAEEAAGLLKNTYAIASKGATNYNLKVIEIARTNTNSAFDYAHELLGVKSLSEFVELSTAHARKQFEAMTTQTKELTELAQKVTTEIAAKDWRHGDAKASNKFA
jgi:phasin